MKDLKLPFDHTILKDLTEGDKRVVLVETHSSHQTRFVTYRVDADGCCFLGRYTDHKDMAEMDFKERI